MGVLIELETERTQSQVIDIKELVGAKILVRQCYNDDIRNPDGSVLIYRPDSAGTDPWMGSKDQTNWAELLMVGEDCELFTAEDVGSFVHCPEFDPQNMTRVGPYEFIIKERIMEKDITGDCHAYTVTGD